MKRCAVAERKRGNPKKMKEGWDREKIRNLKDPVKDRKKDKHNSS
jgi:23S rRNA C2498 (ribose-2'-O)-methylase RlmM